MKLSALFRRAPAIRDRAALTDFIDRQAAFIVQKGIYEYARARAGHYSKVLFGEKGFRDAVEIARWRAYPLGLAMVTEAVEGLVRPHAGPADAQAREALLSLALAAFDRYQRPEAIDGETWDAAREELVRRLALIGLHAPKPAMDIPEPFAEPYFALMPVHEKLRGQDFPTTRNYLRVTMCNIHEEFRKGADLAALGSALRAGA